MARKYESLAPSPRRTTAFHGEALHLQSEKSHSQTHSQSHSFVNIEKGDRGVFHIGDLDISQAWDESFCPDSSQSRNPRNVRMPQHASRARLLGDAKDRRSCQDIGVAIAAK